jgi:signal transduction histidine kinase
VETSKRVTDTRDYGIRADAGGAGGETGTLVSTFNAMLDVISAGDRALQYRIEFERVVERVSRRFIEADAETLDDVIGWSLEQAGALVCAGRSYLFRVAPDGRHFSNTHEWCAPGVRSGKDQLQSLSIEDYAFVFDSLTNERLFMVDDVEGLPDSLGTFQGLLKGQSVGSLINVPLNWGGKLQGFIGMDAIGQTGRWQRDDIDLLNIIAEVMAATLQRLQAQEALNQLNEELEKRVRSRTEELVLANQEMESFTYSVSHDLRSPLLVLDGFSQALLEDYGERLDDQGRTYLAYLREGSQELGDMIDALLSLSRSTRGELHCQSIDLSALATNCVADLRKSDPDRQVRVTIAEDLWGYGDLRLVRQVMVNLLDNAWKYTAPTPDARIEVGQETLAGRDMFFVSDNGVGFDIEHAERLFQPFQRMHREDEFPGTGIGLATVKRILLRHGGRVWTESAVGEGTTFYFNLGETKEQA